CCCAVFIHSARRKKSFSVINDRKDKRYSLPGISQAYPRGIQSVYEVGLHQEDNMSASINTSYFNQGNAAVFFGNEVIEPFTKRDNILDSLLRFVTFGKCNYRKLRENFNQAIYLDYRHGPD